MQSSVEEKFEQRRKPREERKKKTYESGLVTQTVVVRRAETQVTVTVQRDAVPPVQEAVPSACRHGLRHVDEPVVERQERSVALAGASDRSHHLVRLDVAVDSTRALVEQVRRVRTCGDRGRTNK